jgi:hypothetical protein
MANEVYYSTSGDLRTAEILQMDLELLLADRASLWRSPYIKFLGTQAGTGSTVRKISQAGLNGYDLMAAVAENASTSNTALTDDSVTLTVARQALQYQISDLNNGVDSVGVNVQTLAQSMIGSAEMRFTQMVCNVADDFSATVGTSGVDMSVDDFFSAIFTLQQASVNGPYACLLHVNQWTDLQNSIRGEAGAFQFIPATQEALAIKGPGYKGALLGVDVFASSYVPTANAGADSAGGMWGADAIGYVEGDTGNIPPNDGIVRAGPISVELERDAAGALTKVVGNYFVGVSILQDGKGVSIITDR